MDERTLNELLECSVCLDRLDSTSKVLPCQHTFCRRCLDEICSTKDELRCPECRSLVEIKVEDLPSNILLIRLLEGMKTSGISAASNSPCTSPSSPRHKAIAGVAKNSGSKVSIIFFQYITTKFQNIYIKIYSFLSSYSTLWGNDHYIVILHLLIVCNGTVIKAILSIVVLFLQLTLSQPCARALYNYDAKEPG